MSEDFFIKQSEAFLATVARLFALEGATKEVAVLANSSSKVEQTDYDNWNGGTYLYTLFLEISIPLYVQLQNEIEEIQQNIFDKLNQVIPDGSNSYFRNVVITAQLSDDPNWREKAKNWLSGSHINNQGKVRSDNIASRVCDGLLFRSQPEIFFYKAIKSLGVSFAPLPVFIKGGKKYKRIEPDFFIIKDGLMLVVEVDGDTVHQETPAEAHDRTTMLLHEGVYFERVKASECDTFEKALECAQKVIGIIERHKASR
ncbi:hypothetical protein FHR92_004893 [Fontibacillus solani]|uniref:DUF559 domain-containing protein n=1 Tax=Fontibacillus solani TaxID=1572857 RepID=A0A7W3SYC3_9BACL|nr:hypothetical protein [Fontibacillus solani]MBA9088394.1 hypothetical protein [Fontibacillus solani]